LLNNSNRGYFFGLFVAFSSSMTKHESGVLFDAIFKNDVSHVASLLTTNVSNLDENPWPLLRAAERGSVEILTLLLDAGANVDVVDDNFQCACYVAVHNNRFDALKLLVERGAHVAAVPTSSRGSLLKKALLSNCEMIAYLINAGAPLDHLLHDDLMNLVAASQDLAVLARVGAWMARNGKNLGALHGLQNRSLCHYIAGAEDRGRRTELVLRAAVLAGANVAAVDLSGKTPLLCAATSRHSTPMRVLVELGADIDRSTVGADTALQTLCFAGGGDANRHCVELLLALGADVHVVDKRGRSACHFAAIRKNAGALHACLAVGGDLDKPDNTGKSARKIASSNGIVPTADDIDNARRRIATARLDLVRIRAFQICVGLQSINLDALQLCEILTHSFGAIGSLIAFHEWWTIATKVKHFKP
jgi:ankyrin repeat protein